MSRKRGHKSHKGGGGFGTGGGGPKKPFRLPPWLYYTVVALASLAAFYLMWLGVTRAPGQ